MEIWKDIRGYEGYYSVSSYGNIRSCDREVVYSNGNVVKYKGKPRKPSLSDYRMIALSRDGAVKVVKISRLVASHFILRTKDKTIVNHIDGNKHNDHVHNLEWCNYSENSLHAFKNNLHSRKNKVSGVFFDQNRGKWASYLYRDNKNIFVGRFETEQEAVLARDVKLKERGESKY